MSDSPNPQGQPEAEKVLRSLEVNDKTILKALAQMHKLQQEAQHRAQESQVKTQAELRDLRAELFELHREIRMLIAGQESGTVGAQMGLVICCGMIRSGSTLQYQVVSDLIEQRGLGERTGFIESKNFPEFRSRLIGAKGFSVVKVHEYMPELEPWMKQETTRIFYTYRDLRSVAISVMRKWSIPFSEVVCVNGWLDNAVASEAQWRAHSKTLVSRYEDLVEHLPHEIGKWATALSLNLTPEQLDEVAALYSIAAQQERIREAHLPEQGSKPGVRDNYDAKSLLHHNHITDGSVDGWAKELEPAQVRQIEERFSGWLREHGYALTTV
jgi:hypothetical protein